MGSHAGSTSERSPNKLKKINDHWWDKIEKALVDDPECYDHLALVVMNYKQAYSFEYARDLRSRISHVKRQRLQVYLEGRAIGVASARSNELGRTGDASRGPKVMDGIHVALDFLLEELDSYSRTVPEAFWSDEIRSLERIVRLIKLQLIKAGEDV